MKTLMTALAFVMLLSNNAFAGDNPECSARALAGRWMFATDVGKQTFFPGGDITALGTFRVDRHGAFRGKFSATVAGWMHLPDVSFSGTFAVNRDCTGSLTFETGEGTTRTDSMVILGDTIYGMSQDVAFLWTYQIRRMRDSR